MSMNDVDQIVQLVGSGDYDSAEQRWMALAEHPDATAKDFLDLRPVIDELLAKGRADQVESMAWAAIQALREREQPADALTLGRQLLLVLKNSEELRSQVTELYEQVYADRQNLETLLVEAGIAVGRPVRRALRTLEVCLAIKPGDFLVGRHEEEAGRVESIDPGTWSVKVALGRKVETLTPTECADRFEPTDADDFRVLLKFNPDRLRSLAEENPADLLENVLKHHGESVTSDQLRAMLSPGVVDEDGWPKWWSRARTAAKKRPHIKIEGRAPYILEYLEQGWTNEQEVEAAFQEAHHADERLACVLTYIRQCRAIKTEPDRATLERLRDAARSRIERAGGGTDVELGELIVVGRLNAELGEPDPDGAVVERLGAGAAAEQIRALDGTDLWLLALDALGRIEPAVRTATCLELLPVAPQSACDRLADELDRSGVTEDQKREVVAKILGEPLACCSALCWFWDKGLDRPGWQVTPTLNVLNRLLRALAEVKSDRGAASDRQRNVRAEIRAALSGGKYRRFMACVAALEPGVAEALRTQLRRADGLSSHLQEDLLNRLRRVFPQLWVRKEVPMWARDDVLWSTEEGMANWQAEIRDLVDVKMKANAIAIGEAAEKGDLSENSEYKFALEERDLLRARLAHMQEQMAKAQRILPEQVLTDAVSVGAKVGFRHAESGKQVEMTFLGPFEAAVAKNIYNYKSPFGQDMMGKRIGDVVDLPVADPPGAYEVISIEPWRQPQNG